MQRGALVKKIENAEPQWKEAAKNAATMVLDTCLIFSVAVPIVFAILKFLSTNSLSVVDFLEYTSYELGAICCVQSVFSLRTHKKNPDAILFSEVLLPMLIGGALLCLPLVCDQARSTVWSGHCAQAHCAA